MHTIAEAISVLADLFFEAADTSAFKTLAAITILGALPAAALIAFF